MAGDPLGAGEGSKPSLSNTTALAVVGFRLLVGGRFGDRDQVWAETL